MSSIEWDLDVLELIEEARRLDPNFKLGETVNESLRKHGHDVLKEMAEEQKKIAERTLEFVARKTKSSGKS